MPLTRFKLSSIGDGGISTAKLADGAVTTAKLGDSSVNSAKIGVDVIAAEDLAANSVTVAELSDGAVTTAKIADSNITTAKIADSNITTAKIADDAVTVAKVTDQVIGRKNLIINGAMQVWQRGTSQNGSNSYGSVDRFVPYASTITFQRSTDAPDGFEYSIETTGTPSAEYLLSHGIELPVTGSAGVFYVGQTITVSYYAKSTNAGDVLMDWMAFRDASTSSSNQVEAKTNDGSDTHTLTTSWVRYSKTYTITGTPAGTNTCLTLAIRNHWDNSIASGNISITGVQLEVGDTATPFEHRSYGEELALCSRYYWDTNGDRYNDNYIGAWKYNGTWYSQIFLPVEMRTTPTATYTYNTNYIIWSGSGSTTYTDAANAITLRPASTHLRFYTSGTTRGADADAGMMTIGSTTSRLQFYFNAEL